MRQRPSTGRDGGTAEDPLAASAAPSARRPSRAASRGAPVPAGHGRSGAKPAPSRRARSTTRPRSRPGRSAARRAVGSRRSHVPGRRSCDVARARRTVRRRRGRTRLGVDGGMRLGREVSSDLLSITIRGSDAPLVRPSSAAVGSSIVGTAGRHEKGPRPPGSRRGPDADPVESRSGPARRVDRVEALAIVRARAARRRRRSTMARSDFGRFRPCTQSSAPAASSTASPRTT
jgi:hypothetical protein